jgi:peptide deformylase
MTIALDHNKSAQAPLSLHFLGDRVLRQPAKRISKVDQSVRDLVKEMIQTMYAENGIGLAAPQVGIHKQLLVVDCDPDNDAIPAVALINPQIKKSSKDVCVMEEGCLSIPGVYLDVTRPQSVEVAYKDETGRPRKLKASGLMARVIQHEMDHLNGVLFVDRVHNDVALAESLKKQGFSLNAVQPIKKG